MIHPEWVRAIVEARDRELQYSVEWFDAHNDRDKSIITDTIRELSDSEDGTEILIGRFALLGFLVASSTALTRKGTG